MFLSRVLFYNVEHLSGDVNSINGLYLKILLILSDTNSFELGRDTCLLADLVGSYSIN
jgi:hypothetical protein